MTMRLFEQVASGEVSPAAAAEKLHQQDEAKRERRKPAWMPKPVWVLGVSVAVLLLSLLGFRRET